MAGAGPAGPGQAAMYAGLQELGVANGEDLKETLTNCTEPLKAIEQFQVGRVAVEVPGGGGAPGPLAGAAHKGPGLRGGREREKA